MITKALLLDHGYLSVIETWGSDQAIIESARMSTQKGFLGWGTAEKPGDEKLLRYLYEHAHNTPFEFAGITFEIQAPIAVFREWHRHRTQSYTEASARYAPLPDLNYIPSVERLMMGGGANRQAGKVQGAGVITPLTAEIFREALAKQYERAEALYQDALASGVSKELARMILPVGRYSKMRASANLRNWLAFLTLRAAPEAQWEIRQYANVVGQAIEQTFPRTWELFHEKSKR